MHGVNQRFEISKIFMVSNMSQIFTWCCIVSPFPTHLLEELVCLYVQECNCFCIDCFTGY